MNVILVTRCGGRKIIKIQANDPPPGIQMELDLPDPYPEMKRRFSYVGEHKITNTPIYLEDAPCLSDLEQYVAALEKKISEINSGDTLKLTAPDQTD